MSLTAILLLAPTAMAVLAAGSGTPAPCDDFAAWTTSERGDSAALDPFAILDANSRSTQIALLQRAASSPKNDVQRLLGDLWASALAEQKHGVDALKPLLERVNGIRRSRDVAELIAAAQQQGLPLLFRIDVAADLRNPEQSLLYLRQGGLGLPDRDFYLRQDPSTMAIMQHYRAYVERLLRLGGGGKNAAADAAKIIDMEAKLARASLSLGQLRDPNNSYLPTDIKVLDRQYAAFRFKDFFRSLGLRGLSAVSLAHTSFFVQADHLLASGSLDTWRAYLRFHLLHSLAPWLGGDVAEAHRDLFDEQLLARKATVEPEQRALQTVHQLLPDLLSAAFLARTDAARLAAARSLIDAEVAVLRQALEDSQWLGRSARDAAAAKLDALLVDVGGERGRVNTTGLSFQRQQLARNALAVAGWRQRDALARIGRAPAVTTIPAQTPAAFYDPSHNRLQVSAAFAAPPLFDIGMSVAARFGGFGALIGHELSHGFDLTGSKFDAMGRTRPWWSQDDYVAYARRNEPLSTQFDAYREDGVRIDGNRSHIENAADLAGLELSWSAYRAASGSSAAPADDRAFFRAWAALWPAGSDTLTTDGLQAPAALRINGPLANMDAFATTFECKPGSGFMLAPEKRVRIWAR
ncbi:MAG: M13 family metallopeptidase [Xanthomonadales bacterium]|nr:M13 family metallopeptidase [Xanthomonadales bacterium]